MMYAVQSEYKLRWQDSSYVPFYDLFILIFCWVRYDDLLYIKKFLNTIARFIKYF